MSTEKNYSRHVSFTYQIIIIVGFFVLFLQLYALATSMYRDNQFNDQIKEFRAGNEQRKIEIANKKLEDAGINLRSMQIRSAKESEGKILTGEEVKIINNSEALAHNNTDDISQSPTFAAPTAQVTFVEDKEEALKNIKKKSKIDQWKYYFFHVE